MEVSHEAMLLYVRSIKAPEPSTAERDVDPKKGRVKKFFKSLSMRKSKKDDDDQDDTRWSDVFRSDRKRGDSFFRRLSFLQPRDSETLSTSERPSFLDRLVGDKPSPVGTNATRPSNVASDFTRPPRTSRDSTHAPTLRHSTTATALDSTPHHTMTFGRVDILSNPSHQPLRRPHDVSAHHPALSPMEPVKEPLVVVREEDVHVKSPNVTGEPLDIPSEGHETLAIVAESASSTETAAAESNDTNLLDAASIPSQDVKLQVAKPSALDADPRQTQLEARIAALLHLKRVAAVKAPMPKAAPARPVPVVTRPPAYDVMDDGTSLWFDEVLAMMGAPSF
ncbi:hypothetical protein H310_07242 [Aphanomyces invadans]|uniref:Uncharacterized protein n=1 Tax=Aphanomyces invadans TaxID=157072 RepID=A0A024U450_9STRA|nr:hypothetical protein H310_07242 [Aphanomyces invadans]ETW00682.1 hypothetical protein H310_07242 [Aphanomyces invadans]|eukprot:XP_008870817.1 hypothetical protein H310_07242 [Aphanomyces invadans]